MEEGLLINMINSLTDEETHLLTCVFHKVKYYIIHDMTRLVQDAYCLHKSPLCFIVSCRRCR